MGSQDHKNTNLVLDEPCRFSHNNQVPRPQHPEDEFIVKHIFPLDNCLLYKLLAHLWTPEWESETSGECQNWFPVQRLQGHKGVWAKS